MKSKQNRRKRPIYSHLFTAEMRARRAAWNRRKFIRKGKKG